MKTIQICAGCGLPVGPDSPGGLCPQCLLKSGTYSDGNSPEPIPTPVPGELFGEYRVIRLLGHGGMGRVYEAEHAVTGRRVALKVIGKALASEDDRKRFLREGRLAAAINHPNVVYVHGSEEVDGVPVIAMELVHGGTLKDRLKQEGTLSPSDAVEAVLQLIDGLEAAAHAGVLHRDIKPANCFIAADGTVKVGDFGLSVSTLARGESLLTATGAVMGTPAYASPEQLRGEELDVRSDIYSVGATLYHLLTGTLPFNATDFVKLITEVLDKQPAPPATVQPAVPAELSRVVLRCLAKDRKARFQDYAQLRDALLPFRRIEREPARPGVRFLASVVDELFAYGPQMAFIAFFLYEPLDYVARERTFASVIFYLAGLLWYLAYYSIAEGFWGAGIGKTICGLRVVNVAGQVPGIGRAALRTLVYVLPWQVPSFIYIAFVSQHQMIAAIEHGSVLVTDWIWLPLWVAYFFTMRRRNGYAAVHDLLTKTRVVVRPRTQARPILQSLPQVEPKPVAAVHALGPFQVRGSLWQHGGEELLLAVDPVLRRAVWIHARPMTAAPLPALRRELSRRTRLRWLTSGRTATNQWDAYEAPSGAAFNQVTRESQPWHAVRFWLCDLAEEIAAASDVESTPPFSLNHLWITASGNAVLLDFPAPATPPNPLVSQDAATPQQFLARVADQALHLGAVSPQDTSLPVYATSFLQNLRAQAFDKIEFIVGNLHSLLLRPAEVTRQRRVAALSLVPACALLIAVGATAMTVFDNSRFDGSWAALFPDEVPLRTAAEVHEKALEKSAAGDDKLRRQSSLFLAAHYRQLATNDTFWRNRHFEQVLPFRSSFNEALRFATNGTSEEVASAEEEIRERIDEERFSERLMTSWIAIGTGLVILSISLLVVAVAVIGFGTAPVLRLFGIGVVGPDGSAATRGRLLWRSILVWGPVSVLVYGAAGAGALVLGVREIAPGMPDQMPGVMVVISLGCILLLLAIAIHAALSPRRSLADRMAGTALVPL